MEIGIFFKGQTGHVNEVMMKILAKIGLINLARVYVLEDCSMHKGTNMIRSGTHLRN